MPSNSDPPDDPTVVPFTPRVPEDDPVVVYAPPGSPLYDQIERQQREAVQREAQARYERLRNDTPQFLQVRNPLTEALWLALLKPAHQVLREVAAKYDPAALHGPPGDEPGEVAEGRETSAIVAVAQGLVAKAILGSEAAFAEIANRIQGKISHIAQDDDPFADPAKRHQQDQLLEDVVRKLTDHARNRGNSG